MKQKVLKLNKYYFPIGVFHWKEAVKNIFSEAAFPIDIQYSQDENGTNLEAFEWCQPVQSWEDWCALPIRPYDEYIQTSRGPVRAPSVVICSEYDKVKWHKVLFPTKQNIWERDKYICGYTGKRLAKEDLSVDHIVPKSKGGEDTWTNLITCDKKINCEKADRLPSEFRLKLKTRPFVPKNVVSFPVLRPEWNKFISESCS